MRFASVLFLCLINQAAGLLAKCVNECSCKYDCNYCHEKGLYRICLKGTRYNMGYQYGILMKPQLRESLEVIKRYYTSERKMSWTWVVRDSKRFRERFTHPFRQFLEGMSTGSGLTLVDVYAISGATAIFGESYLADFACAFGFIPTSKTESENAMVIRNFDLPTPFGRLSKNMVLTTLIEPSAVPTSFLSMAGQIYCQTCFNARGLYMQLNNGMPSGGYYRNEERSNMMNNLLSAMQNSHNYDQLSHGLMSLVSDFSLIVSFANGRKAATVEYPSLPGWTARQYEPEDETAYVTTNFYQNKTWYTEFNLTTPDDNSTWHGVTRKRNLETLIEAYPMGHTHDSVKMIMEVPLTKGGAVWEQTNYQAILDIQNMILFTKRTKYDRFWVKTYLKPYYV